MSDPQRPAASRLRRARASACPRPGCSRPTSIRAVARAAPPWRRSLRPRSRGQALVEFALILPVFLLLLLIAVDFGRMFFSYIEINNAAREGASYAATNPTDSATIQARMLQETNAQAQKGAGALAAPVVTCHDTTGAVMSCATAAGGAGAGNTVTVSASEPFTFLTPFINGFFSNSFTMSASATSAVLQYGGQIGGTPPGGCSPPVASFTVVVSGNVVTTDPSASTPNSGVCNISGYNWDWGDGTTDVGTASSTTHTYVANSNYWITLTVTNQGGTNSLTEEVTIGTPPPPTCSKPVANFTYTVDKKTYSYTDTSTVADPVNCPITAWYWTFDDGTHSNAQNPTYTYGNASAHTATLQVTNAGGTSTVGPK